MTVKNGDILISQLKLLNAIKRARQLHELLMILSSPRMNLQWWYILDYIKANRN